MRHWGPLTLGLLTLAVTLGCGSGGQQSKKPGLTLEPQLAAPLPPAPPPQEGSLWTPRYTHGLVADHKAFNVGDLVTIVIAEGAKAGEEASTKASKASGVKLGVTSLFGLSLPINAFKDKTITAENALEGMVGNTSHGEGKTERQSAFATNLTAKVIQVLPNQNLVIQGQRHLRINNETEVVTLTGMIRPQDVDRTNTVASTRVADARVEISGYGVISDKQRQGWLTRIIDHIWPW